MFNAFTRSATLLILVLLVVLMQCDFVTAKSKIAERPYRISLSTNSNPVTAATIGAEEIIFVKRKPYSSDHYYTDISNGTSPDRFHPENGIYIYNISTTMERPVVTAKDMPGGKGLIGKISLCFDAKRVLFDFRENPESGFRIWEVNVDGSGLRQVLLPPEDEAEKVARWENVAHR